MIQGVITAILLVAFLGGTLWIFSSKRKPAMDAAARLALDDQPTNASTENREKRP